MKRVYFIRPVGQDGPIKIGATKNERGRLAEIQAHSPVQLEIAAVMDGDFCLERRFQCAFLADRLHSEWFAWSPELGETMASIAAGAFDPASLPTAHLSVLPRAERGSYSSAQALRRKAVA